MSSDTDTLTDVLKLLADPERNFRDPRLEDAPVAGVRDTTIYFYPRNPTPGQQKYTIKKFARVRPGEGGEPPNHTGRDRFLRELSALEVLSPTGRVCPVVVSSKHLPASLQEGFAGPYFIVKPFYGRFLDRVTPGKLRLLEWAAQEADISDKLLRAGWRDLDGNPGNDALCEDGRIVRVDLDGVHPTWASAARYNDMYHAPHHSSACYRMRAHHRELTLEEAEVDSLAIRLCRLFLSEEGTTWEDVNRILALKHRDPLLKRFLAGLGLEVEVRRKRRRATLPTERGRRLTRGSARREARLRKKWLRLWLDRTSHKEPTPFALTASEATLVGRLFFKLLSTSGHGLSLSDLYYSFMLLALAAFKHRRESISRPSSQLENILRELHEYDADRKSVV